MQSAWQEKNHVYYIVYQDENQNFLNGSRQFCVYALKSGRSVTERLRYSLGEREIFR